MNESVININNLVGNFYCVDPEDGKKVYNHIQKLLRDEKKIKLSFKNVELITPAFLNTAIGQLYRDFSDKIIKKYLSVVDISQEDLALLKRVIDTAKIYYKK